MLHKLAVTASFCAATMHALAQNIPAPSDTTGKDLNAVEIISTKADARTPMAFTNISKEQIEKINYGQDIPYILREVPSLVMTSDGGTGIGYTGLWLRGSDASRINVTINDIPLNDPESQQVFWVNLPDFASSTDDIQVQRGVGTSTNGVASFGGTIKMGTNKLETKPYLRLNNGFGSFNTLRNTVAFGTGLRSDRFLLEGRLSRIASDGYIDRATARLASYFLTGAYVGEKTTLKLTTFGGQERTYQSWYGTPASRLSGNRDSMLVFAGNNGLNEAQLQNLLNSGRTYNFYTYENQVDDYRQTHYQLHLTHIFNQRLTMNAALHYTKGLGFFEEFRDDESFERYGLVAPNDSITSTDIIRRRWLDNHFYGGTFSIAYKKSKFDVTLGGAANQYIGDHFGELIWMQFAGDVPKDFNYYRGESTKNDGNIYARSNYRFAEKFNLYVDVQGRMVQYITKGIDNDLRAYDVNDELFFFNPKAGLTFNRNKKEQAYFSVAVGNKEPNRNDYVDAPNGVTPRPESMIDFEGGYAFTGEKINARINLYYMQYKDQLVLTGELNDVGAPLRMNVDNSFRRGIELEIAYRPIDKLLVSGNATFSQNKIEAFEELLYDYTNGFDIVRIQHSNTDIAFSPSVIAGGRAEYFVHKNISVSWLPRYVGRQYLDNTQNEFLSIDPYFVNDIAVRWSKITKRENKVAVQVLTNNAFNEMYSSNGYTFSYIFDQRITERFFYPQAGRFFLLSFQLEF